MFLLKRCLIFILCLQSCLLCAQDSDTRRVVFLGLTNAGKTTLINYFYTRLAKKQETGGFIVPVRTKNVQTGQDITYPAPSDLDKDYLVGEPVTYHRFKSGSEEGDYRSSDTTSIVGYTVRDPDTGLHIELVDTPGFFDSDGAGYDYALKQELIAFFSSHAVHSIVIVVNGQNVRNDPKIEGMYETILSILPADAIQKHCLFVVNKKDDDAALEFEKNKIEKILHRLHLPLFFTIDKISPAELLPLHQGRPLTERQIMHDEEVGETADEYLHLIKNRGDALCMGERKQLHELVIACQKHFQKKLNAQAKIAALTPGYMRKKEWYTNY